MNASGPDLDAIIPARALQELSRLAASSEAVELGVHENHVIFSAGDVWLTSRRIDGQFPNYKQLLPETFEIEIATPRRRCSRSSAGQGSWHSETRHSDCVSPRASSPFPRRRRTWEKRRSPSRSTTPVRRSRSASTPTSCGTVWRRCPADTVQLKLINRLRPGLLAAPDESFWYLIMPIRLAG